jgi:hypothetical protein
MSPDLRTLATTTVKRMSTMDARASTASNSTVAAFKPVKGRVKRKHTAKRPKLISRAEIDGRTVVAQRFDAIAAGIAADLGGEHQLSTVMKHLVEGFAGIAVHVGNINARLLLGEQIDVVEHSQVISSMVRVASRIGLHRVAREVQSLDDYLQQPTEEQ